MEEEDIGNLIEETKQKYPTNFNNSCFLDGLLMVLFYKKKLFVDYCFLHSILQMEFKKSKWIYGNDPTVDLEKRKEIQNTLLNFVQSIRQNSNESPNFFIAKLRNQIAECNFLSFKNVTIQQDSIEYLHALGEILQLNDHFNNINIQVFGTNDLLNALPTELIETTNRIEKTSFIHRTCPSAKNFLKSNIDSGILKEGFKSINGEIYQRQITIIEYIPTNPFFILEIDRTMNNPPIVDRTLFDLKEFMFESFELQAIGLHNGITIHSGHYTCLIKTGQNSWILYDDTQLLNRPLEFKDAINRTNANENCVFLLFTRV